MDCCGTSCEEPIVETRSCPRCGQRGRTVGAVTLDAMLREPAQRGGGGWRFCRNTDCPVVYFSEAGAELEAEALTVRVGQKEYGPDRPICYCFGYSASDLLARPSIQDEIKAACKRGEDRCAETNPQGSCCLGNVAAVLRRVDEQGAAGA